MSEEILQIDLDKVIRERAPKVRRMLPGFVVRSLERLICQDRMNDLLVKNYRRKGVDFSTGILEYLGIKVDIVGTENLPAKDDDEAWRVIFASNHPLGGLDGMALIDLIGNRAPNHDMRFIVNDLLMNIPPLQSVFLPVNTLSGHQSRHAAAEIDRVMESDIPVAIFPAGLCSRLVKGRIQDLKWNKMFVNKAIQYRRDIIPVHFYGENSAFFYKFAKLRKMLRIPINLEMSLLPRELFRNEGCKFTISIGKRIKWESLHGGKQAPATAADIREKVYALPNA